MAEKFRPLAEIVKQEMRPGAGNGVIQKPKSSADVS